MATEVGGKLYEHFAPPERHTLMLQALARGDEAEAVRLKDACPRKDYTQADAGFVDRREVAFEIMLVACIDLRSMWAKLHMLQWAIGEGRRLATWQQINATMAFLDGEQFGKGRPQLPRFGEDRLTQDQAEDDAGDEEGANEEELESDNESAVQDPDADDLRMSKRQQGQLARRMVAVEDRAQHATDRVLLPLLVAAAAIAQDLVNLWAGYGRFCRSRLGVSPEVMMRAWEMPLLRDVEEMLADCRDVQPQPEKVAEYAHYCCTAWDRRFGRPRADEEDDGDGE